jgi:hypothetical protein
MEPIIDCLNNQFLLYDFISCIDNIIQYLDNNNLNINYYCIALKEINEEYHIITSNTIKNKEPGYKLITIKKHSINYNNQILESNNILLIYYENFAIQISDAHKINVINPEITYAPCNYAHKYNYFNKDINELNYTKLNLINYNINLGLFKNLEELTINCGQEIPVDFLPKNLQTLIIHNSMPISKNVLPDSLNKLFLGYTFNNPILAENLPYNLKILHLDGYNHAIKIETLPPNLEELIFGNYFNKKIKENSLPESLKILVFGKGFRQRIEVNVLPTYLEKLVFSGGYWKHLSVDALPRFLKNITISGYHKNIHDIKKLVHLQVTELR